MRALSVVVLVAAACAHRTETHPSNLRSSDFAVYQAALDSMFVSRAPSSFSQLVIGDSTEVFKGQNLAGTLISTFSRLSLVDTAAVKDLTTRSREAHALKELSRLGLRIPVVFVDRQALKSFPGQGPDKYWSQFYQRYPGSRGLIRLSAIGYGANGDLAILMVDQFCGGLCGNGYIVALRRVGGMWRITAIQRTWVS